jgi:hypothetical protein
MPKKTFLWGRFVKVLLIFVLVPWIILSLSGASFSTKLAAALIAALYATVSSDLVSHPNIRLRGRNGYFDKLQATVVKVQAKQAELLALRNAEQAEAGHQDDHQKTRIALLDKAIAKQSATLALLSAQSQARSIQLWLNRLDKLIWEIREARRTQAEFVLDHWLERTEAARESGEYLVPAAITDPAAALITHAARQELGNGMEVLRRLDHYLRDQRVLEAVGGDAMPEPDFLQSETALLSGHMSASLQPLDSLDGMDQESLYEIKGKLRVAESGEQR